MSGFPSVPMKRVLARNDGGVWGNDPIGDAGTVVLRSTDIALDGSWAINSPALRDLSPREATASRLVESDLVVVKSSGSPAHLGKTAIVTRDVAALDASFANFVQRLRLTGDADPRFAWHFLNSSLAADQLEQMGTTTTGLRNITRDTLDALRFPCPPPDEQRAIADYLDRETARIDALIAAKKRMVTLASERFTATVSDRIFGAAAGSTVPLKRLVSCLPGLAFASDRFVREPDEAVRLLRGVNVGPQELRWDDVVYWPRTAIYPQMTAYALSAGDLVLGMDRPWIGSGIRVATIAEQDLPCLLVQRVARVRPFPGTASASFVKHALASHEFREYFAPITTGVSVPHISDEQITAFRIPMEAVDHQEEIAAKLDAEAAQLAALKRILAAQVDLLRERRQALITAAVTGQNEVSVAA